MSGNRNPRTFSCSCIWCVFGFFNRFFPDFLSSFFWLLFGFVFFKFAALEVLQIWTHGLSAALKTDSRVDYNCQSSIWPLFQKKWNSSVFFLRNHFDCVWDFCARKAACRSGRGKWSGWGWLVRGATSLAPGSRRPLMERHSVPSGESCCLPPSIACLPASCLAC